VAWNCIPSFSLFVQNSDSNENYSKILNLPLKSINTVKAAELDQRFILIRYCWSHYTTTMHKNPWLMWSLFKLAQSDPIQVPGTEQTLIFFFFNFRLPTRPTCYCQTGFRRSRWSYSASFHIHSRKGLSLESIGNHFRFFRPSDRVPFSTDPPIGDPSDPMSQPSAAIWAQLDIECYLFGQKGPLPQPFPSCVVFSIKKYKLYLRAI